MADENKNVKYSFTGDTSSLQDAAKKALNIINSLDAKVKQFGSSAGVDKLTSKMKGLGNSIKDVSTKAAANAKAMQKSFSMANVSQMKKQIDYTVAGSIAILRSLSKQFDSVVVKIQSMKTKAAAAFAKVTSQLNSNAAAFRRAAKASDDEGKSEERNVKKAKNLMSVKQSLSKATAQLSTNMKKLSSSSNEAHRSLGNLAISGNKVKSIFAVLTGYKIGSFLAEGTKEAIRFTEIQNMFTVAMGESNQAAEDFVKHIQEIYGLDPSNIMRYTSMFYQLASAVDTPTEAAEKMSKGLTQMTVDIASLFDMPIDNVMENLSSGMQGMSRAVRKYGMDIRNTTLEQTALSLGISRSVSEMSEADRQGLRYITMMRQAAVATGDFGKTIESPANQLRVFKEQVSQLARAIGNFFIPILSAVLPYLNGFIMALRTILGFFGKLIGITPKTFGGATDAAKKLGTAAGGAAGGVGDIGKNAKDAAKKMKDLTAPFDELNILSEDAADSTSNLGGSGGGGGFGSDLMDPAIAQAIADMEVQLENVRMKANDVRDSILDFLGFHYEGDQLKWVAEDFHKNLVEKFPQFKKTIDATFENWDDIIASVKRLGSVLLETFKTILSPIVNLIVNTFKSIDWDTVLSDFITKLPDRLNAISDWIEGHQGLIQAFTYVISGVALAFKAWSVIQPFIPILTQVANAIKILTSFLNPVSAAFMVVGAALIYAYKKFDSVKEAVSGLKDTFSTMVDAVSGLMSSLWENILQPILENIGQLFSSLWTNHVEPLIENFALFAAAVLDAIMSIITIIAQLCTFVIDHLGPDFTTAFNLALGIVTTVVGLIIDLVSSLIKVFTGIIEFLTGVFTGDWKKAWKGIKKVFSGVWDGIKGIGKAAVNFIIDILNALIDAFYKALTKIIDKINKVASKANDLLGTNLHIDRPEHPGKIPHLARGGVVTSPTVAMIGEGKYDEAVIPLGDSPQMKEMVNAIVDAMNDDSRGGGGNSDIVVNITAELDGDVLYKKMKRIERSKGRDFKMGGFQRG